MFTKLKNSICRLIEDFKSKMLAQHFQHPFYNLPVPLSATDPETYTYEQLKEVRKSDQNCRRL